MLQGAKRTDRSNSHDGKVSKHETQVSYVLINATLLREVTQSAPFHEIKVLNLQSKTKGESKIRKIEGLDQLVNLEELNLSFNAISKLENLECLQRLKELNLADNNIKKIENIDCLTSLERLNLNGNLITHIPEYIGSLTFLTVLKLSRNRIEEPAGIVNLQLLESLRTLHINENPICKISGHIDLCIYICQSLEYLDSKKITTQQKETAERLFNFERKNLVTRDLESKDCEIKTLRDQNRSVQESKMNLADENKELKKRIKVLEQERDESEELLQKKTQEVQENIKRISELEHEISQYKIEYLYKKFMGNNWMSCGSTQPGETVETHYSLKPYDSNLRTDNVVADLQADCRETLKRLSVLQDEKTEIGKKLKQSKEQLQSFETQLKEAEETKSTDTKGDQNPNFIKILRKSEKLTELESKAAKYRQESSELFERIEEIKEKIHKSNDIMQKLSVSEYDSARDDRVLLQNNRKKLTEKLNDFEHQHEKALENLANCNSEIDVLKRELAILGKSDGTLYSTSKTNDSGKKMPKLHREQLFNSIRSTKILINNLNEQYEQIDQEMAQLSQKLQEYKANISEKESLKEGRRRSFSSNQRRDTEFDSASGPCNESVSIGQKLAGLLTNLKRLVLSVNSTNFTGSNKAELDVTSVEELITQFSSKETEPKALERSLEKCGAFFDRLKDQLEHLTSKKERVDLAQEQKLNAIEEKLRSKLREEEEVNNALRSRINEFEKVSSVVSKEKSLREELFNSIKVLYERVYSYRKQLKILHQTGEMARVSEAVEEIDGDLTTEQETEKMVTWIQKILRYLEATFERIQAFNEAKEKFLHEFEQETKDLSKKWRELESRKEEFHLRLQKEKDEFKQKMQNQVSQFEEERAAWRKERRQIEEQRQNIHDEFQKMISNRELLHESMKKNQEKKDYIRRDLECKIQALEMQFKQLRAEVEEEENYKKKIKTECNDLQRLRDSESQTLAEMKHETSKLGQKREELYSEIDKAGRNLENAKKEKQILQDEIIALRKSLEEAEEEYNQKLDKYRGQERCLKRSVEALAEEADAYRRKIDQLENKAHEIHEQLSFKEQNITELESLARSLEAEKDTYRKQKQEIISLVKEAEELRVTIEEYKMKIEVQENSLDSLRKQNEAVSGLLREKQMELQSTERKVNSAHEKNQDAQFQLDRLEQTINSKQEEIARAESERSEMLKEVERVHKKLLDLNELGRTKELVIEKMEKEYAVKLKEMQEYDEFMKENEQKYKKLIQENRETLDMILKEIKQKEEEYHNLMVDIDQLAQQKCDATASFENIEKHLIVKEEQLRRIMGNLELAQSELSRIHQNILNLTEEECQAETRIERLRNQEKKLADSAQEISQQILRLHEQEQGLTERVRQLQVKEDSVYVLMALEGEHISPEMEQKIKKMVENHGKLEELKSKFEALQRENTSLKEEVAQLRRRVSAATTIELPVNKTEKTSIVKDLFQNSSIQHKDSLSQPRHYFPELQERKISCEEVHIPFNEKISSGVRCNSISSQYQMIDGYKTSHTEETIAEEQPKLRELNQDLSSLDNRRRSENLPISYSGYSAKKASLPQAQPPNQSFRDSRFLAGNQSANKENVYGRGHGEPSTPKLSEKNAEIDTKLHSLMSQIQETHQQITVLSNKCKGNDSEIFETAGKNKVKEDRDPETFKRDLRKESSLNDSCEQNCLFGQINFGADQNLLGSAEFNASFKEENFDQIINFKD